MKSKKLQDPFAQREAKKYDYPIASREAIIELLKKRARPISYDKLVLHLQLKHEEEKEGLRRRLIAMVRDGQLLRNRRQAYSLIKKTDLIKGTVQANKDGYGFFIPDNGGEDLYLGAKQMRRVFDGDHVLVRLFEESNRNRPEAVIVEVLQHNTRTTVGRFCVDADRGNTYVIPSSKQLIHDIYIDPEQCAGAVDGQMVKIEIIEQPNKHRPAIGKVVQILGDHLAPGMEIDVALLAYNIPHEWSQQVTQAMRGMATSVDASTAAKRKDLRQLPLLTIDGEDARDFDDAVYCEPRKSGGWRLLVAIADVSHYIELGSRLDEEALQRGNSVYFPERVIPMLPEALSNGLCSLNPHVDRLCMVCDIALDAQGKIVRYRFYDAVMNSKARMTYTQVAAIIAGDVAHREQHAHLLEHFDHLHSLYQLLRRQREQRGALDFDSTETRIVFSADKKIEKILPVERNVAHQLIEECMLAANVCAAKFLKSHKFAGLYRNHEAPSSDKVFELRQALKLRGISLGGGEKPTPLDFQQALLQIEKKDDPKALQLKVLRTLNQAEYAPANLGHFGLAYKSYAHFTSPIRRYPDLLLHRAIRHHLNGKNAQTFPYNEEKMAALGEHCSMTERRADDAVRDVTNWLKCEFMSHCVGNVYEGKVTGVTGFGLFVQLDEVYVEGLVHISSLTNDYYHFDAQRQQLRGEYSGETYTIGSPLVVCVVRVDMDQRQIDFIIEQ